MAGCGIAIYGRDEERRHGLTGRAGCGKWACPDCAERNKKRLTARAINGMLAYPDKQWFFVTLTAASYHRTFKASLAAFRSGYRKVYKAMIAAKKAYALQGDMLMLKMYEQHSDGTLHIHIITDVNWQSRRTRKDDQNGKKPYVFMPVYRVKRKNGKYYYRSAFLADKAASAGLGYIGECRPITSREDGKAAFIVAAYIAKYVAKSAGENATLWPKYAHRCEFSANWPALPERVSDDPHQWQVASRPAILRDYLDRWQIDDQAGLLDLFGIARVK